MTYYLIATKPDCLDIFQKRLSVLKHATKIHNLKQLTQLLLDFTQESIFLVDLKASDAQVSEMVLLIKNKAVHSRVIYVVEENKAHNLKLHQSSALGGDAYVSLSIEQDSFHSIIEGLSPPDISKITVIDTTNLISIPNQSALVSETTRALSSQLEEVFQSVVPKSDQSQIIKQEDKSIKEAGENMGIKDQELSLGELEDLDFNMETGEAEASAADTGLDLGLVGLDSFELADSDSVDTNNNKDGFAELTLIDSDDSLDLSGTASVSHQSYSESPDLELGDLDLNGPDDVPESLATDASFRISELDLDSEPLEPIDLSEATRVKLKEIDEIMVQDASKLNIHHNLGKLKQEDESFEFSMPENEDEFSVVQELSPGFELDNADLDFNTDSKIMLKPADLSNENEATSIRRITKQELENDLQKPTEKQAAIPDSSPKPHQSPLMYAPDMERTHATISNLRADREELLAKIQKLEDDKSSFNRQTLSLRAELDETKIVLTITRKKLSEEINDLKNKLQHHDEKKLILEEKNKALIQDVEKAGQKTRIDVKKVQLRERELEQKLELLKSDAETQIRNRDLKILELKRKIDAMEFDMESISFQEKRSNESRYDLEDKLEKAIKTLKGAISVLEEESDRSIALDVLKKNIDV